MKFISLLPWFRKEIPDLKALLIYGNHEGLIGFRRKYLQKLCHQYGNSLVVATTVEEALEHYHSLPGLFDSCSYQKCIVLEGVTDSFLTKIKTVESLESSPHFLLLSSSRLSSRSKLAGTFQENSRVGTIACYEVNKEEISQACQKILKDQHCQLSGEAFKYLSDFLINEVDQFFSLLEMIVLYAGSEKLEAEALKVLLLSFQSSPLHKLTQYFFQEKSKDLQKLIKAVDPADWISMIRLLSQDVRTILTLQEYHLRVSDLKNSWSKGPVKFPYPQLSLYEQIYSRWSPERCALTLKELVNLEKDLKSTPSPLICQISDRLMLLSGHGNIA